MVIHEIDPARGSGSRPITPCSSTPPRACSSPRPAAASPPPIRPPRALLGLGRDEIRRLGMAGLVDHEDPRWGLAIAERDRSGSWVGMVRFRRGDGRMVDMETTTRTFRDGDGAVQILSILHDAAGRLAIEREMEELSARLLELAQADELTGFQNRRGLLVAGNRLLKVADREESDVQVLFADVENVQELNERLGLHAGDAALQAVARALSVAFRTSDVLARIGGTQFLVLALDLREADCATVMWPHAGPSRRSGDDGVRRWPGRRVLRLDHPPGR